MPIAKERIAAAAIRERMLDSFAPTYLTLISILQGASLGYLFYITDLFLGDLKDQPFTNFSLARILFVGSTLIINIATWNEYRMGSTTFVWVPRLLDTLVPFALALVQFSLIRTIRLHPKYWFLSVAGFLFLAAFGFWHMYYRASRESEINEAALRVLDKYRSSNPLICGIGAVANLLFSGLIWRLDQLQHSLLLVIVTVISGALLFLVLVRGESAWSRVIQFSCEKLHEETGRGWTSAG
jgi:hypothetical protein